MKILLLFHSSFHFLLVPYFLYFKCLIELNGRWLTCVFLYHKYCTNNTFERKRTANRGEFMDAEIKSHKTQENVKSLENISKTIYK